jgi:hypothetical protein
VLSQDDLARGNAVSAIRRNSLDIPIDNRIAGGGAFTKRRASMSCAGTQF